jgi:hypothetical protein
MKPLAHWMKHVPEDVRKHLGNLRADYTRKTQAVSDAQKSLTQEKAAFELYKKNLVQGSLAQQVANVDTETKHDLFDPEGMKAEIKRQAQLMMKDMLAPAQQEIQVQERRLSLQRFKDENPNLTQPQYKTEIVALLKARPELKLEDAYYITHAKLSAKQQQAVADDRTHRRNVLKASATGSRGKVSAKPTFASAWEAYQWAKSNQGK